jgi:hypothetical protein
VREAAATWLLEQPVMPSGAAAADMCDIVYVASELLVRPDNYAFKFVSLRWSFYSTPSLSRHGIYSWNTPLHWAKIWRLYSPRRLCRCVLSSNIVILG